MQATASLVFAADARQVTAAAAALDTLKTAGGRAETAATAVERSLGGMNRTAAPAAAAMRKLAADANAAATATKLTANQSQQLAFQLQDFFVQVQAGQSPLTALIQQGSQLSGTFGGVGGAIRAVVSIISPFAAGVGGAAAAAAALAHSAYRGSDESRNLRNSLLLTANAAGITEGRFNAAAASIAASTNTTIGSTREILQTLISTGRFSGDALISAATAAQSFATATGQGADDVLKSFVAMGDGVANGAERLNKQYNFLTAAQLEQIKSAEGQGDTNKALTLTFDALNQRMSTVAENLGLIDRVGRSASNMWSGFYDWMKSIGRETTAEDKLDTLARKLRDVQALRNRPLMAGQDSLANLPEPPAVADLREQQGIAQEMLRLQRRGAEVQAANAARNQAEIEFGKLKEATLSKQAKLAKELANANALADRAGLSAADRASTLAAIREKYAEQAAPKATSEAQRYLEQLQEQLLRTKDLTAAETVLADIRAGRLKPTGTATKDALVSAARELDQQRALNDARREEERARLAISNSVQRAAQAASEESARMAEQNASMRDEIALIGATDQAKAAIEQARIRSARLLKEEQLQMLENSGAAQGELQTLRQQIELLRERESLTGQREQKTTAQKAADEAKKVADDTRDRLTTSVEEGLLNGFRNGKSLGKVLTDELKAQFAKTVLRPVIEPVIAGLQQASGSAGSGLLGILQAGIGLFSGGLSYGQGINGGAPLPNILRGGRANGGPVERNSLYQVNERGPELLTMGNKQFLMMGAQSGHVTPNSALGGGGITVINQTSGRVDKATMVTLPDGEKALLLQEAVDMAEQRINGNLSNPNSRTSRALNRNYKTERNR